MVTMKIKIVLIVTLLSSCFKSAVAQIITEPYEKEVYAILVKNGNRQEIQTGFRVKGEKGIFTALHGLVSHLQVDDVRACQYSVIGGQLKKTAEFENLKITELSIDKDLVRLMPSGKKPYKELQATDRGFVLTQKPKTFFNRNTKLLICGFPELQFPQTKTVVIASPPVLPLYQLLYGSELKSEEEKNTKSNALLRHDVIQLEAGSIFPGHSGGPIILDGSNEVVGIANGGLDNEEKKTVMNWAVSWSINDLKLGIKPSEVKHRIEELKFHYSGSISTEGTGKENDKESYRLIAYPKASPNWIFGFTLGIPIKEIKTSTVSSATTGLMGFADVFVEKKIASWLMLGGYYSSSLLQYDLLESISEWDPSDIIESPAKLAGNRSLWGLQSSFLLLRRPLSQLYLGGGIGGINKEFNKSRYNYRAYLGFRYYVGHRQRLALDGKVMYITQTNVVPTRNYPWGNTILNNLNQLNVCVGLNYSFRSRN